MGVPKFFRYISERYPCLSEVVKEYQIPEFDNLYLDMNGIIHMCSHPDDGDPHFRITEEKIFMDIFHYIEVLFRMIKPTKLFFMAVDGVAPRAKMNQQRGRRFRSAKEAVMLENKAIERGEVLPAGARFDSNCITPGTIFMANLQEQLKYFIVHKITTDKLWKNCKVILSGQETPGEGEHKIMDYIRYMRAQPGYDPNTRHCLYGLDADLIMLGLCTHEPHFSLLREEVRFGKKSNKRKNIPEQITFYLLHLSLMREYLELEFLPLKDTLKFKYDMEKIIDDWVLMGFLVGNDFIPHLPNMHIDNGALPILYNTYMKVLPKLGGYINEDGILNLQRFEVFIQELSNIDITTFTEKYADLKWFEAKRVFEKKTEANNLKESTEDLIDLGKPTDSALADLIKATDDMLLDTCDKSNLEDDSELENDTESDSEENLFQAEFIQHKTDYYMNKLEYKNVTGEVLKSQAEEYVRAIQWNLHYYYNGVCSWSWYYPHHYAPYISDIKDFSHLTFDFELGQPFKPYEQLLGVLPAASKELLPKPYQDLMTEEDSPINMYYPEDFKTDLNGKKQEWEAVVLIPFIEEDVLLKAMESCYEKLTLEEVNRNNHGPMLVYQYTTDNMKEYICPQYFPNIMNSHAKCKTVDIDDLRIPVNKLIKGRYPGAIFDVYYPGFPTMKHLNYTGSLEKAKVRVFEQPSRGENMILHLIEESETPTLDLVAKDLLGKTVLVGWPHLVEALVVSIATKEYKYYSTGEIGQYNVMEHRANLWETEKQASTDQFQNRLGIDVGRTEMLVYAKVMTGRKYIYNNNQRIELEKQWSNITTIYPLQTIVKDIKVYEENYKMYKDVEDVFPVGSHCFMLGQPCYGVLGEVLDSKETIKNGRIKLSMKKYEEPDLSSVMNLSNNVCYMNTHVASTKIAISKKLFGRITGSVYLIAQNAYRADTRELHKANIGLNLKFNKKNEEIPGYTRKEGNTWYYSEKAVDLVCAYMMEFPMVFEYLNFHDGKDIYEENDMFPDGNPKECIREITSWIKKQPFNSIERQVCGGSIVDPEAIQLLEEVVDTFNKKSKSTKPKQVVVQVKPHLLYKHTLQMGNLMPDPAATFELYDRVVNVREGYTVPMGYKGTIIGIHKSSTQKECETTYDVLFDQPFAGALSINSSSNRCYQMTKPALINISHGLRALEKKSGKPGVLQNMQSKMSRNNYNNGNMNYQQMQFQQPTFGNWTQNGNFPTRPSAQSVIQNFPPTFNTNPNFNGPSQFPISPFQAFHNATNYNQSTSGPHSFVPYKNNHFALNPPPISPHCFARMQPPSMVKEKREGAYKDALIPTQVYKPTIKNKQQSNSTNQLQATARNAPIEQSKKANENVLVLTPEDVFAHARAGQLNVTKNLNTENDTSDNDKRTLFHTTRLLKEFQTRNLGCPNYQFFTLPDGKFVANVIMADGSVLVGDPAISKDQAADNTALEVLRFLNKGEKSDIKLPLMSPQVVPPKPPTTWQNTQHSNHGSPQKHWTKNKEKDLQENWRTDRPQHARNDFRPDHRQDAAHNRTKVNPMAIHKHLNFKNSSDSGKKKQNASSVGTSFIPLQAVQSSRSRNNSSNASETILRENMNMNCAQSNKSEDIVPTAQANKMTSNTQSTKPKRERKMRIAANFQTSMNSK